MKIGPRALRIAVRLGFTPDNTNVTPSRVLPYPVWFLCPHPPTTDLDVNKLIFFFLHPVVFDLLLLDLLARDGKKRWRTQIWKRGVGREIDYVITGDRMQTLELFLLFRSCSETSFSLSSSRLQMVSASQIRYPPVGTATQQ